MSAVRSAFGKLRGVFVSLKPHVVSPETFKIPQRSVSIYGTKPYDPDKKIEYEVSKNPEEWNYVLQSLPLKTIPDVKPKDEYPSGWKPQLAQAFTHPYYMRRTKNHMVPVYLKISHRGTRRLTVLRKIEGDIMAFERDLKTFLMERTNQPIGIKINEAACTLTIRGDHVYHTREFVDSKGF